MSSNCLLAALLTWTTRRWLAAVTVAAGTFLLLGLPRAVIAKPVFGRAIAPTPWAMQVLIATSVLAGLLAATYVRNAGHALVASPVRVLDTDQRPARRGVVGGLLAYLAIGCPVCNKVVLIVLGTAGAVRLFAPVQPYLAAAGVIALTWALIVRLRGEATCAWAPRSVNPSAGALPSPVATGTDEEDH
jgi:hypothetical protein